MKKIYLIINDISMPGGLARVALNMLSQFKEKYSNRYDVKIITGTISNENFKPDSSIINLSLNSAHKLSKLQKVLWYVLYIYKLKKFFSKNEADILIGIATMTNLSLSFIKSSNYKIFATEHLAFEQHGRMELILRKYLYKRLDKVISLTRTDELKYKLFHSDVCTIPNFTTFYNNQNLSKLDNKNILTVGRFTKQKGFDILVDFVEPFFKKYDDWTLTLIGEGPIKEDIKKSINNKSLQNNIIIKDPTNKIEEEYLNSSIYVMTSRYEGFPMVLLEAKAFGLPIVSFNCPTGPSEILKDNEDGFIIPMGENDLFLEKLEFLVENINLRKGMGKKASENIKDFYPESIMQKWEKILDE